MGNQSHTVKIQVQNRIFLCDKEVLCKKVDYFKSMFSGNFKENTGDIVKIHNVEENIFATLLDYVYTGRAYLNIRTVLHVRSLAEYYCVDGLVEKCDQFLRENMDDFNVTNLFITSTSIMLGEPTKILAEYIIAKDSLFRNYPYTFFFQLVSTINDARTVAAIVKWVMYDSNRRRRYVSCLLRDIRLDFTTYRCALFEVTKDRIDAKKSLDFFHISNIEGEKIKIFGIDPESGNIIPRSYSSTNGQLKLLDYMKDPSLKADYFCVTRLFYRTFLFAYHRAESSFHKFDDIFGNKWIPLKPVSNRFRKMVSYDRGDCIYANEASQFDTCDELTGRIPKKGYSNCNELLLNDPRSRYISKYVPEYDKWFAIFLFLPTQDADLVSHHNGGIYVVGNQSLSLFDPRAQRASNISPLPLCVSNPTSAVLNDNLYVSGECTNSRNVVQSYDMVASKWIQLSGMYHERGSHSLVPYKNRLYAVGGNPIVEVYSPEHDVWKPCIDLGKSVKNLFAMV